MQGDARGPQGQAASSQRPVRRPQNQTPEAAGERAQSQRTVYLLDPVVVKDLASALELKPFKVIADLIELKCFKSVEDSIDFETAQLIARKHGFRAERPPPGVLVL